MTETPNRPNTIDPHSYEGAVTERPAVPEPPWVPRIWRELDSRTRYATWAFGGVMLLLAVQGVLDVVLFGVLGWLLGGSR